MVKAKKKELLSSAPWRGEDNVEADKFKDAKVSRNYQINQTGLMRIERQPKKNVPDHDEFRSLYRTPAGRRSFNFNFLINVPFLQKVFSFDTVVKPLPPAMGYNITRNWNFFTRIFTQFFDPDGIANAQKSQTLPTRVKRNRKERYCQVPPSEC
ncbi:hypothetical protein RHGRI_019707 [Rhododendron griersonianum]|uniref:Uncharacterized protein n=1 Tax=Rhododendron griersonianum TaxID=479676 RepID=A0AAV6JFP8_9ERIC|nr:hypothetical protein RHGRI_019707 [Rhododendron griersonianum]